MVKDIFILVSKMSSISLHKIKILTFICFFGLVTVCFCQQRQNDFTKRVRSLDGKLNSLSSKRFSTSRINSLSSQRFSVEEWPSKFSPFGGKRFPMQNKKKWGTERIETTKLPVELPYNQDYAVENNQRTLGAETENRNPAAASIEFRDAYYAQLDKRVDEWMNNVNNMSLRDINRFQFRKGRPSEPGFPVQQAGSQNLPKPSSEENLGSPSVRGVMPSQSNRIGAGKPSYWLGPKKVVSTTANGKVSPNRSSGAKTAPSFKNFNAFRKPVLGPKKVRVQVK